MASGWWLGVSGAGVGMGWAVVAPSLMIFDRYFRFLFRHSRFLSPVIPALYLRHSREGGNPQRADAVGDVPGARASRPQSRACARRALILTFSHKGRGDLSLAIHA